MLLFFNHKMVTTMQRKYKNIKQLPVAKPLLWGALALIGLVGGILMQQSTRYDFITLDNKRYQWRDLHGEWVVLNYFAPWCAPCLKELPELNQFARAVPEHTRLLVVNYDRTSMSEAAALYEKYDMQFELIVNQSETKMPVPPPAALPATYLIDPQGNVVHQFTGEITATSLRTMLDTRRL